MDVTTLRKSGKLREAYELAKENLEKAPDQVRAREEMAWVLFEYLKLQSTDINAKGVNKVLKAIRDLGLDASAKMFYQSVAFTMGTFLLKYKQQKHPDVQLVEEGFQVMEDMPFPRPSEAYSWLLKGFLAFWEEWPGFIGLMNWWGWDQFRDEDFKPEKKEDKVYASLVEKLLGRYAKILLNKAANGDLPEAVVQSLAGEFLNFLKKEEKRCAGYAFTPYYQARVMLITGDKEGARSCFLSFARKKTKDFWVWELLGELIEDEDLSFACKVRALSIKTKPEFLIRLRESTIPAIVAVDEDWAKTELDRVVSLREKRGWPLSNAIKELKAQAWYQKAKRKSTDKLYETYVEMANRCLLGKGERVSVLIYSVIAGGQKAFGVDKGKRSYRFSGIKQGIEVGKVYEILYQSAPNGWSLVQQVKERDMGDFSNMLREEKGRFVSREGQAFGFVKDIFVPPYLVKERKLYHGMEVRVTAVPSYDPKKEKWGFQAYRVEL